MSGAGWGAAAAVREGTSGRELLELSPVAVGIGAGALEFGDRFVVLPMRDGALSLPKLLALPMARSIGEEETVTKLFGARFV